MSFSGASSSALLVGSHHTRRDDQGIRDIQMDLKIFSVKTAKDSQGSAVGPHHSASSTLTDGTILLNGTLQAAGPAILDARLGTR
jgi:hypothetical protein